MKIETKRLILREMTEEDFKQLEIEENNPETEFCMIERDGIKIYKVNPYNQFETFTLEVHRIIEKEGFDGKLTDVTLDEERTKLTGQNNYIINSEGSIIKRLFPDYENKDVIEKKAYFQTIKEGDTEVPEFFVALVKYRDGEKVIEKSIYLQVSVNNWEVV